MSTQKKKSPPKKVAPVKKPIFSAKAYRNEPPAPQDIQESPKGGHHIPILALENSLDIFRWGTSNFQWQVYNDSKRKTGITASLVLTIHYQDEAGKEVTDHFVGACNFLTETLPFDDFLASAKSLCIKNAASDIGRKFGRGLNEEVMPAKTVQAMADKPLPKPDKGLRAQHELADESTRAVWDTIFDFKTQENGNETV